MWETERIRINLLVYAWHSLGQSIPNIHVAIVIGFSQSTLFEDVLFELFDEIF